MALVDFSTWTKTKNPTAVTGQPVIIEQRVDRLMVYSGQKTGPKEIALLSKIIAANNGIGQNIANQMSLRIITGLGFDAYYAGLKATANARDPSAKIITMVREILARKTPAA